MTKQELYEQKGRLATQAEDILKRAGEENRYELSADENRQFEAMHADIDKINAHIARIDKQEAATVTDGRRSEPAPAGTQESRGVVPSARGRATQQDAADALRSWLLPARMRTDAQRAAAGRIGVGLDSPEFTFHLPSIPLASSRSEDVDAWRRRNDEQRAAMGTTSGAVGQYAVPDAAMQALEIALLSFGGMRNVATVLRTDSGAALPFPTSDDTSNKGAILTENSQVSEVDITFGQLVLDSYMYSSKSVLVSLQLLQDAAVNVPEMIGRMLGERIGRIQNDHFTTGSGTGQPKGAVTAATDSTVTAASATLFTYDELVNVLHAVDPAYRMNARWMFSDATLKNIKKIKVLQYSGDTTGQPLWAPGLATGSPDTILGYPYSINQSMAAPGSGNKAVLFGDFSKYMIRDVREITLVRLNERYADYHQVGFLAFARSDGDLLDAGTNPIVWADHT
jgi:HK97 family phage major capsid protein